MNQLNSIIIEGELTEDPSIPAGQSLENCSCLFPIRSRRFIKVEGTSREETHSFTVITHSKVAEGCIHHLKKGRGIRVVGRLVERQPDDFSELPLVYITAEHVEFKPMIKAS